MPSAKNAICEPVEFEAFIGGFMGNSYGVKWENGGLRYDEFDHGYAQKRTTQLKPSEAEWMAFWKTLNALKVWKWKREYFKPVCDGTNWKLIVRAGGRKIESGGSNDYPHGFEAFCAAVSTLIGGREFI